MNWEKKEGDPVTFVDEVADNVEAPEVSKRSKPDIEHLEDAVDVSDEGQVTFLPKVGEKVVIERCVESGDWLDTNLYTVKAIDTETGALNLIRDEYCHYAQSNFIEGILRGYRFKLPPKKGPVVKRKVRVRDNTTLTVPEKVKTPGKGRGRPKGSKNRPKDVIQAEKDSARKRV